jgi:hypothetical protein
MPSASYLTVAEFSNRTIMPLEQIARLEQRAPGWLAAQIESSSRWADMYLAKRYRVPFRAPYPEAVQSWVARMVTQRAYLHHGISATDDQQELVASDATKAEEEIKQAADGQLGLIDITDPAGSSAVQFGGTRVYSEASPYVGMDQQRERGSAEDLRRRGT